MDKKLESKLDLLIKINEQMKDLKNAKDKLKEEILAIDDNLKTSHSGYLFTTSSRKTYKVKKDVDVEDIIKSYPTATKIDAKKLYQLAQAPELFVDITISKSITAIAEKTKDIPDF